MIKLKAWKKYLDTLDISDSSKQTYYDALVAFSKKYNSANITNVQAYKADCQGVYSVNTINLRVIAINKYNTWDGHPEWHVKQIKYCKKTFLDNVITLSDFKYLCSQVKKEDTEMYFLIKFMGCTGARISEVLKFKGESVQAGYMDIMTKGRKHRRIYIPKRLRNEALAWKDSGLLFTYEPYKIRKLLRRYSTKYKLDIVNLHPHAFRHFFAIQFLEKFNDLSLLADLLGHDSIETTRIYLRRTSQQQAAIVDNVVTW